MGALVKRDRNHPAVVIWSFCNEAGCEGEHEAGGPSFREIAYEFDGSRPTLANMFTFGDLLSNTIDVQGFSHQARRRRCRRHRLHHHHHAHLHLHHLQDRKKLDDCHAKLPHKPIYMSECCSCNTYRDEDIGCETLHDNPHSNCTQISFNARCAESNSATNASDAAPYAVGTMVWTLFDYYGEPYASRDTRTAEGARPHTSARASPSTGPSAARVKGSRSRAPTASTTCAASRRPRRSGIARSGCSP